MPGRLAFPFLLACIWPTELSFSQEADRLILSLAQAEEFAFKNNPVVTEANTNYELARAKRAQASHARFLPRLNLRNIVAPIPPARAEFTEFGVLISPDTAVGLSDLGLFTEMQLDLVQPIWTFGRLSGLKDAAEFGVEAEEANISAKKADVRLQVRKLYWGLVLGYELLNIVEDVLAEVEDAEQKLEQKLDEGSEEVTQNDLFKFQIFRYEIDKRHRDALDNIELGKAALRAAIGLDETVAFELETQSLALLEVSLDSLVAYTDMALRNRPEVSQLRAGINARSSLVKVSSSGYLPEIFVGAQVKLNRAQNRFDSNNPFVYNPTNFFRPGILVGLNWNLNFLQTRDKVRVAQFEHDALAQREASLSEGIRLEVREAYLEVENSQQDARDSQRALRASDNWLRAEAQTFDLGIGEVKDFIDAFRANATMRSEHMQNIFNVNTALAQLSKAVGTDLYPN